MCELHGQLPHALPAGQRGTAVEREVHARRQQRDRQDAGTDRLRRPSVQLLPVRRLRPYAVHALRPALLIVSDIATLEGPSGRSEERRVGKEGASTCRSRGAPDNSKKKIDKN